MSRGEEVKVEIMKFLMNHEDEIGVPATIRDIAAGVGLSSTSTVIHHLHGLVAEGDVHRMPGRARTIRLSQQGRKKARAR